MGESETTYGPWHRRWCCPCGRTQSHMRVFGICGDCGRPAQRGEWRTCRWVEHSREVGWKPWTWGRVSGHWEFWQDPDDEQRARSTSSSLKPQAGRHVTRGKERE